MEQKHLQRRLNQLFSHADRIKDELKPIFFNDPRLNAAKVYSPSQKKHNILTNLAWVLACIHTNKIIVIRSTPNYRRFFRQSRQNRLSAFGTEYLAFIKAGYRPMLRDNNIVLIPPQRFQETKLSIAQIYPSKKELNQAHANLLYLCYPEMVRHADQVFSLFEQYLSLKTAGVAQMRQIRQEIRDTFNHIDTADPILKRNSHEPNNHKVNDIAWNTFANQFNQHLNRYNASHSNKYDLLNGKNAQGSYTQSDVLTSLTSAIINRVIAKRPAQAAMQIGVRP